MLDELDKAIKADDTDAVRQALFELSGMCDANGELPDKIAVEIIDRLRQDNIRSFPLARHVLNYFEFDAPYISPRAKNRCNGFLLVFGSTTLRMFTVFN